MDIGEYLVNSDEEFLKLASSFGNIVPSRNNSQLIDLLLAKTKEDTTKNSLSKRFGMGSFPIHTDGAYFKRPPRFILLRYVGTLEKVTPSVIVHFDFDKLNNEESEFIKIKTWYVSGINGGFYSNIYNNEYLRYDLQVMKLVNSADNCMDGILKNMKQTKIIWSHNKVAVINNWACLHFRPELQEYENEKRILQRINIQ